MFHGVFYNWRYLVHVMFVPSISENMKFESVVNKDANVENPSLQSTSSLTVPLSSRKALNVDLSQLLLRGDEDSWETFCLDHSFLAEMSRHRSHLKPNSLYSHGFAEAESLPSPFLLSYWLDCVFSSHFARYFRSLYDWNIVQSLSDNSSLQDHSQPCCFFYLL